MDTNQNLDLEFPIKCVVIKDFSDNYIRYDLIHSSLVQDLNKFISKLPMECFFQNYKLEIEKTGKKIYNDDNLFTLDLKDFDIIHMVPSLYDPNTATEHFETLKYILEDHPFFVGAELLNVKDIIFRDYEKLVETTKQIHANLKGGTPFPFFSYLLEEQKQNPITRNKISLEEIQSQVQEYEFKKQSMVNLPNSYVYETKNRPVKYRCLNAIYLSSYNWKLQTNDAPKGDLLYIEVITLENNHYIITNTEKGFIVNNSKQNKYDPTQSGTYYSYTLPGLLCQLSPSFKENFVKTLSQNVNGDDFMFLPTPNDRFDWILPVENPFTYNYRFKAYEAEKRSNFVVMNKEWNEEYQGILDIKNLENMNLETREKLLVPFYGNFRDIAMEGAKLISSKKIKPFSMSDSPSAGYYIYGNIFITLLEDRSDFSVRFY